MRFFIAFILSFCLYFSNAQAAENKAISTAQNLVIKSTNGHSKSHFFNKKQKNTWSRDFYDEDIKLIHQHSSHAQLFHSIGFSVTDFKFNVCPIKSLKTYGTATDFGYWFILAYLYPKHSFW